MQLQKIVFMFMLLIFIIGIVNPTNAFVIEKFDNGRVIYDSINNKSNIPISVLPSNIQSSYYGKYKDIGRIKKN